MQEEIKEILDKLQKVANRETASRNALMEMKDKDYQLLLDYITSLQEEIERLNNIIDELEKDINNQLTMTRKLDKYNEGFFNATLHYYNKLNELGGKNE